MSTAIGEVVVAQVATATAMGRLATPMEIATAIVFVESDDAVYLTGAGSG